MITVYRKSLFLILFLTVSLVACNENEGSGIEEHTTHNPTPEEILSEEKDADIFLEGDVVYKNAQDIDWVNEEKLTVGEEIGEIKKQSNDSEKFEDFTATKLPVGVKIYEPEEDESGGLIYIIKMDDEEMRYLGLVEG